MAKAKRRITEDELKEKIVEQLVAINLNRSDLLDKAYSEGGIAKIIEFEDAYDALQDSYYEIVQRRLNQAHHRYEELTQTATTATSAIEQSIQQLESVSSIIGKINTAVSTIGQILIVLGL